MKKVLVLLTAMMMFFTYAMGANAAGGWTAELNDLSQWTVGFTAGGATLDKVGNGIKITSVSADPAWQRIMTTVPVPINLDETPDLFISIAESNTFSAVKVHTNVDGAIEEVILRNDSEGTGDFTYNIPAAAAEQGFTWSGQKELYVQVWAVGTDTSLVVDELKIFNASAPAAKAPAATANPATGDNGVAAYVALAAASLAVWFIARKKLAVK